MKFHASVPLLIVAVGLFVVGQRCVMGADLIAGVQTVGNAVLPDSAMTPSGLASLRAEGTVATLLDPQNQFLLVASHNLRSRITKVDLTVTPPTSVAERFLEVDEPLYRAAAIDPNGEFAYFVTTGANNRIIKIRTSDMARVDSLDLTAPSEDISVSCMAIDHTGSFAYLGTSGAPGKIIKFSLAMFQRVATLTLATSENHVASMVIDPTSQFAYIGTSAFPARVVRINLSNFSRDSAIVLPSGEFNLTVALIDPTETYLYFGCGITPGAIIKIRLSDFTRVGSIGLPSNQMTILSGFMDPTGFYAYFGVYNTSNYTPELLEVDLLGFLLSDQKVIGNGLDAYPLSGVIQSNGVFAYFGMGLSNNAGVVIRVSMALLGQSTLLTLPGYMAPERGAIDRTGRYAYYADSTPSGSTTFAEIDLVNLVRTRTMNLPDSLYQSLVLLEPTGRFAYVSLLPAPDMPAILQEIDLETFTLQRAATLSTDEEIVPAALIDPDGHYAYLATFKNIGGIPFAVVRVDLATMQRVDAIPLNSRVFSAAMDPSGQYGYFLSADPTPRLDRIILPNFQYGNGLQLLADEAPYTASAIDPLGEYLYYGTNGGGKVVKIDLNAFSRVGNILLPAEEPTLISGAVDPSARSLYLNALGGGGELRLVRIDTATFTRVGAIPVGYSRDLFADPQGDYLYMAGADVSGGPGIQRISLGSTGAIRGTKINVPQTASVKSVSFYSHASIGLRRVEGQLFQQGSISPTCSVIDTSTNRAYFGVQATPGKVVRFDLNTLSESGTLTFADNFETDPTCAVIDPARVFAYFGCFSGPGKVVKVRLSDFTQVGTLTFAPGENNIACAVMDPSGTFAYFACNTDPPLIVKVQLSNFTRVGSAPLNSGEGPLRTALITPDGANAYFGAFKAPGKVVRVNLTSFSRDGVLDFNAGENLPSCSVVDSNGTFAYFGTSDFPSKIVKVQLSNFARVNAITLNEGEEDLRCAVIDPANAFALFGSSMGKVIRINLGTFARNRVANLFATDGLPSTAIIAPDGEHAWFGCENLPARIIKVEVAPRPLRLALYQPNAANNQWTRLWQSDAVAVNNANALRTIAISGGTPTALTIPPGDYYLTWQADAHVPVGSHLDGTETGFEIQHTFGPFPYVSQKFIFPYTTITNDQWTSYITYTPQTAAGNWAAYR